MKSVTMLELRKNAAGVLRRIRKGERFVLTHRGRPVARLEPVEAVVSSNPLGDSFLTISRRAVPSPKGKTDHAEIDRILYGRK